MDDQTVPTTRKRVMSIIRDGQLCFYCTSLAAVCVNDILRSNTVHQTSNIGLAMAGERVALFPAQSWP